MSIPLYRKETRSPVTLDILTLISPLSIVKVSASSFSVTLSPGRGTAEDNTVLSTIQSPRSPKEYLFNGLAEKSNFFIIIILKIILHPFYCLILCFVRQSSIVIRLLYGQF